ncbi:MAG: hypothetical protein KJP25_12190 [Gammaproteobacteria bacterium]|nr:hypothetical protein [Gammaproteobacteria bacterium]NND38268.1 hypothetical protein [Pseudomonadales bacterium]MBT8150288.1 hypothetical protein [Gammaproteobacteria bacterium]NNL11851.1 hypothetical protein [Pseudomonadales bacterium]NNM11109.1 hypothetical protein [Pseudomonadales bacterium]
MMSDKIKRLCMGLLCLLTSASVLAGISVEPAVVDLNFNAGRATGQFVITNTGDKDERYRIVASFFTLTESGGVQLAEETEHSMASWIKFNPKEFHLPPKSKRLVRFVVLPKKKVEDGQYWAAMELESLEGRDYSTKDEQGRTFNLKVIPSVLAPMFGRAGKISPDFEIKTEALLKNPRGQNVFEIEIGNKGNAVLNFRGYYQIEDSNNEVVHESAMDGGLLLRDKTRKYVTLIDPELPPGNYTLKILYASKGLSVPLERELEISF